MGHATKVDQYGGYNIYQIRLLKGEGMRIWPLSGTVNMTGMRSFQPSFNEEGFLEPFQICVMLMEGSGDPCHFQGYQMPLQQGNASLEGLAQKFFSQCKKCTPCPPPFLAAPSFSKFHLRPLDTLEGEGDHNWLTRNR